MNVRVENGLDATTKQAGCRGGVWSMSEVLSELLPRYAPPAVDRAEPVSFASLDAGWRPLEIELASCS
ncbi:MAG TPA: hypothetical protein VMV10_30060 [Pirellulales bacterium]|nr:hypothetical protein [Pirellulales bacterium]